MHIHRSLIRVCALPAKYIYYTAVVGAPVPGSTPGRRTTGPPTPPTSRRINNSCTRALDALTNSQLHPKCIRFAGDARRGAGGEGGGRREGGKGLRIGPAARPRIPRVFRDAVARIYIYVRTPISMQRGSFFELARSRRTGKKGSGEDLYDIRCCFFFLLFFGALAESSLALSLNRYLRDENRLSVVGWSFNKKINIVTM